MPPRMPNPASIITEAMKPTHSVWAAAHAAGVAPAIRGLVHLRASQINGCAACLELARA